MEKKNQNLNIKLTKQTKAIRSLLLLVQWLKEP